MPVSPTSYHGPSSRAGGAGRKFHKEKDGEVGEEIDERRVSQREKQIGYGINTDGYRNMLRLIEHDPRLCNGRVLPLEPPGANLKVSKRTWDLNIRRWRRALHMFDYIYIEGEDDQKTTLADVVELQRQQWVNPEYTHVPKINRVKHRIEDIMAARTKPGVPKKIPVEDNLVSLLKDPVLMHESVNHIQTMGVAVSPQNAGYKVLIGPNQQQQQQPAAGGAVGSGNSPTHPTPSAAPTGGSNHPSAAATPSRSGTRVAPPHLSAVPVGGAASAVRRSSPIQFGTPQRGTPGAGRHRNVFVEPTTASRSGGGGGASSSSNHHPQQQQQRTLSPLTQEGRPLSPVMMMTQPKVVPPRVGGNSPTNQYNNSNHRGVVHGSAGRGGGSSPTSYHPPAKKVAAGGGASGGGSPTSFDSRGVVPFPSSLDDSLNQGGGESGGTSPTNSAGPPYNKKHQHYHQDPTTNNSNSGTRSAPWRGGGQKRGTSPTQQHHQQQPTSRKQPHSSNAGGVRGSATADFGSWRQ